MLQEALQQMRAVDDKIIYKLNTSVPTISFADQVSASDECKHLYDQVRQIIISPSKFLFQMQMLCHHLLSVVAEGL